MDFNSFQVLEKFAGGCRAYRIVTKKGLTRLPGLAHVDVVRIILIILINGKILGTVSIRTKIGEER